MALDDFDVATAASLREHMRLPGLSESTARHFRDKLAMRVRARQTGLPVPDFTGVFNYDRLRDFMARVTPPWVLKPRFSAGAIGIQKIYESEALWRTLDRLGDAQSNYLLEQFLPGDVYHVDSVIYEGKPLFARASKYGEAPLSVTQGGGIFSTHTLDIYDDEHAALLELNQKIMAALGHQYGVSHTEFIRAHDDGRFYFLETAARVAGASIDKMVKAASGIDLWTEAARIEVSGIQNQAYELPPHRDGNAGLIICLARQEHPDLLSYQDPEIIWRVEKPYHAGLLVASPDAERVESLLNSYSERFAQDFLHHIPGKEQKSPQHDLSLQRKRARAAERALERQFQLPPPLPRTVRTVLVQNGVAMVNMRENEPGGKIGKTLQGIRHQRVSNRFAPAQFSYAVKTGIDQALYPPQPFFFSPPATHPNHQYPAHTTTRAADLVCDSQTCRHPIHPGGGRPRP